MTVTEWISRVDYLCYERQSETKHEYFQGQIRDVEPANIDHIRIVGDVLFALMYHLRFYHQEDQYFVFACQMRVMTGNGFYTYPDVVVLPNLGKYQDEHDDILLDPTIVIEVMSSSTATYDRGEKFQHYRTTSSLTEYILIAQDTCSVEHYTRDDDDTWQLRKAAELSDTLYLPTIDCALPLSMIYTRIGFERSSYIS
ncbi:MAG: Uma2 family endonuclease [Chloroflexota bacterium]